jgi:hypothetical protein
LVSAANNDAQLPHFQAAARPSLLPELVEEPPVAVSKRVIRCQLNVTNDLFNFLTKYVRTSVYFKTTECTGGFETTTRVRGNVLLHILLLYMFFSMCFTAIFRSKFKYVAKNKRESATIFFNNLIAIGAMTYNFFPGPSFIEYKEKSRAFNQRSNFSLHNARNALEKPQCFKNITFSESGKEGVFICNLRYVCKTRRKYKFKNLKKNYLF